MNIVGHAQTILDLKRLADGNALAHGYLFYGPSMVGKRTITLALANYLEGGEFVEDGKAVLQDTTVVSPVGGSVGIDAVRGLKNFFWQRPAVSVRRTAIIDGAESMTQEAQNAILKIAEEPPQSSLIILIASDAEGLLPTLVSRLQKIYFSTIPDSELKKWLKAEFKLEGKKLDELTAMSFGKPGLAATLLRDKKFQNAVKSAELFLKTTTANRREFIKKLIEPEDFRLAEFLDAVIMLMSQEYVVGSPRDARGILRGKINAVRWHKLLELKRRASYFGLNPRLQLESLLI